MNDAILRRARAALSIAALPLAACSSLIGLGDLEKADCGADCAGAGNGSAGSGALTGGTTSVSGTGSTSSAGTSSSGGSTGGSLSSGGTGTQTGGTSVGASPSGGSGGTGSGGEGGDAPNMGACPGGPEPPLTWTEHWFEHDQVLTRVYYDDCVALYFDPDMADSVKGWLAPFLSEAWKYSLENYGKLGSDRVYAVAHQGHYSGGHVARYDDPSHDNRNVIDMAGTAWADGNWDMPATLYAFLVDSEGSHTKLGAPKSAHYGNVGFPLIYKYDLYLGLGLTKTAESALTTFNAASNSQPFAGTYWFRDWFYPIWHDHGHAQVFANYQSLLEKYYPVDADNWMPTMNYGQYFHFMSGAAGVDLVPLARDAFEWHADFDDEIAAAKVDFPDIKY